MCSSVSLISRKIVRENEEQFPSVSQADQWRSGAAPAGKREGAFQRLSQRRRPTCCPGAAGNAGDISCFHLKMRRRSAASHVSVMDIKAQPEPRVRASLELRRFWEDAMSRYSQKHLINVRSLGENRPPDIIDWMCFCCFCATAFSSFSCRG